jgi:hypothetical protein
VNCNGTCVAEDNSNCGTCGNACTEGQICARGTCLDGTTIGLPTPGGQYTNGNYAGWVWAVSDADGSTVTRDSNVLCVTGTAIQVPYNSDTGQPDWGGAWGVVFGWNLNDALVPDGGAVAANPADLSAMRSITVAIAGAGGLNLRIGVSVKDADGGTSTGYCANLPANGSTTNLTTLTTNCWPGGYPQTPFDPATMQPNIVSIQVVPDTDRAYPFNFCVTALSIDGPGTGGTGSGGAASGGTSGGGMGTGGVPTGGKATGGVPTGGKATGGKATGGVPTGGVSTGGIAYGGKATGGTSGSGA